MKYGAIMIGLGPAGFAKFDNIRTVHRERRREGWTWEYVLTICYDGDENEYEFLYQTIQDRDDAYVRLCNLFQFIGKDEKKEVK